MCLSGPKMSNMTDIFLSPRGIKIFSRELRRTREEIYIDQDEISFMIYIELLCNIALRYISDRYPAVAQTIPSLLANKNSFPFG